MTASAISGETSTARWYISFAATSFPARLCARAFCFASTRARLRSASSSALPGMRPPSNTYTASTLHRRSMCARFMKLVTNLSVGMPSTSSTEHEYAPRWSQQYESTATRLPPYASPTCFVRTIDRSEGSNELMPMAAVRGGRTRSKRPAPCRSTPPAARASVCSKRTPAPSDFKNADVLPSSCGSGARRAARGNFPHLSYPQRKQSRQSRNDARERTHGIFRVPFLVGL